MYRKENENRYQNCKKRIEKAFERLEKAGKKQELKGRYDGLYYTLKSDGSYDLYVSIRSDIRKLEKDVECLERFVNFKLGEENNSKKDVENYLAVDYLVDALKDFVEALGGMDKVNELEDKLSRYYFGISRESLLKKLRDEYDIELF